MIFKASDIQAINAAIDQFKDMVENGSEDERHQKYHDDLISLLRRIKANHKGQNIPRRL
ncbi:hypothetical protein [Aliivibrio fischeri]|uniref:hypothetical protein n=1 Tax=Aliivibrio fischeri TaxID=668 RepID=UPI000AABD177|nr:hypothetical protein [Aliivibrio fischeri]